MQTPLPFQKVNISVELYYHKEDIYFDYFLSSVTPH